MPRPHNGYFLKDGTRVPGVTTILSMMSDDPGGLLYWAWKLGTEGKDYRKERDKAAGIGTIVHAMIDGDLMVRAAAIPTADEFEVTAEEYATMLVKAEVGFRAYQQWKSSTKLEIVSAETQLVSEVHRFGGTPDAVAHLNGSLVFLDWKAANAIYSKYIAQVAAYSTLWVEKYNETPESAVLLRVGKDEGDFHVSSWPRSVLDMGWEAFQHSQKLYELKNKLDKYC